MIVLRLFLFMLRLLPMNPASWDAETSYRFEIATACSKATDDRVELLLCAKIPRYESNYREDVGRCEVRGAAGEVTAWQILPRNAEEKAKLCRSLDDDAVVAVARIRESRTACRTLPANERLALYARGRCDSDAGKKLSRHRWPYEREVRGIW